MVNLINLFNKLFHQSKDYKNLIVVDDLDEIDYKKEILARKFIVLGKEKPKWIYFECPCGCRSTIQLNLMKSYFPKWRITINKNKTISIYPSVINTKCDSHFWINKNKVLWHKD